MRRDTGLARELQPLQHVLGATVEFLPENRDVPCVRLRSNEPAEPSGGMKFRRDKG